MSGVDGNGKIRCPCFAAPLEAIMVLMPMTSPRELSSGPPELPGLIARIGLDGIFNGRAVSVFNGTDGTDDAAGHGAAEAEGIAMA